MQPDSRIYVAGHRGLVGGAIVDKLRERGFSNLILRTHAELDLTRQESVEGFFRTERLDYVFLAAAKVGGILANSSYPADFLRDNLAIQLNVIDSAYRNGVKKLQFLGSSCIYPKLAPQPLNEDALLTGPLEPTNEWYAIAKICGIKQCEAYRKQYGFDAISVMPTNLYGPGDNFHPTNSHVLPALIRKFHEAKTAMKEVVSIWGSGTPRREFLHVRDMADACVFLMEGYSAPEFVNIGTGEDITIKDLALMVQAVTGFQGKIEFDPAKPDGTPRKLMDVQRLHGMGWRHRIELEEGVRSTYDWFLRNIADSSMRV